MLELELCAQRLPRLPNLKYDLAGLNARILKKYIGKRAEITEKGNSWGAMGAIVAEVNENNILTFFLPGWIPHVTCLWSDCEV